jgi:vacuolar-type H+-ATPase subunit H
MTTTDMQKGGSASVHDLTDDSAGSQVDGDEEARRLVAKARFDAFQVVTEARKEAESILDDARREAAEIITAAEMQAESIVDAARLEADETRAGTPSADPITNEPPETTTALEAEHEALVERVTSLRAIADQLEERFAALAASSATGGMAAEALPPEVIVEDGSAHVDDRRDAGTQEAGNDRGSFYNRRSAKLPSIGDAGGRSALDMMKSIRGSMDDKAS